MSDTENTQWFFIRGLNKASTLMAGWFPSEPEVDPDSEVGVLRQRIALNQSYIDDVSAYWYSLSIWGKIARAGILGIGALAIGIAAQAPILVFTLYVLAAVIINSVLSAHEQHRRFTSKMLVDESVELTGELNKLKEEHAALNEHITRLIEGVERQAAEFNQTVESLNETIRRMEREGNAIPDALAEMNNAAQDGVDMEKQIIATHEKLGNVLSQLNDDLDSSSLVVSHLNKTLDVMAQACADLNKDDEHIKNAPRVNANALFQPEQAPVTVSNVALEFLKNKEKYCEESRELERFIKENNEIISRYTQSVC
ncbi:MAG: hypothetical protein ACRC0B_00860 [Legionella sp.]